MDLTNLSLQEVRNALKNFGYESDDIYDVEYMEPSSTEGHYKYKIHYFPDFDGKEGTSVVFVWQGADGELCGDY